MKILIVHNNYGKYSGEEAVVDKMATMLRQHGHDVAFYRQTTEGVRASLTGQVKGFFCGIYSPSGVRGMRETLRRERPDVVNVHNLYPFISPAALFECKKAGVPVVMTVHNFRLICPTGLFMRDNRPCELCLEQGNEWGCIRYNCEHSMLKSMGYAARNAVARWSGAYSRCVDRLACITDFQRQKLMAAGWPSEKITVIPNSIDVPKGSGTTYGEEAACEKYVAFCGRLSQEKGVDLIIEVARRHPEISFKLAGEVREAKLVEQLPDNVFLAGYIGGKELEAFYRNAAFFVMASSWYEGFPMSILEAAQYGKCTVGPNHGGFTEIIGTGEGTIGRLFAPGNVDELEQAVVDLWQSPDEAGLLGEAAFKKLMSCYSTEVVYRLWEPLLNDMVRLRQ